MNRWCTILEFTNKFCGCYTQIENRNESGKNEQDRVLDACTMYKDVADPLHRSFILVHCWHVLRHEEKWKELCSQKNHKGPASTPGTNESRHDEQGECHTSPTKDARPPGKKKAKEQQRRGTNSGSEVEWIYMDALETMWTKKKEAEEFKELKRKERDDMFFALEQQKVNDKNAMEQRRLEEKIALEQKRIDEQLALEKRKHEDKMAMEKKKQDDEKLIEMRRLALQERELDDKVMAMDVSGMDEIQQQYYKRRQWDILARHFSGGSR